MASALVGTLIYVFVVGLVLTPFVIGLYRAYRHRSAPGMLVTSYVLLAVAYGFTIFHVYQLQTFWPLSMLLAPLGAAGMLWFAFSLNLYWAAGASVLIFVGSVALLRRVRSGWLRMGLCLPLGAALYFVPIQLQTSASERRIAEAAGPMGFDCFNARPLPEILADTGNFSAPFHGWARRGEQRFYWSFSEDRWIEVPPGQTSQMSRYALDCE